MYTLIMWLFFEKFYLMQPGEDILCDGLDSPERVWTVRDNVQ